MNPETLFQAWYGRYLNAHNQKLVLAEAPALFTTERAEEIVKEVDLCRRWTQFWQARVA